MDPKPQLSIIIPTYNDSEFLPRTICHLINQIEAAHCQGIVELIVVNDGSTDDTNEVLNRFRDNGQIRVISNSKNLGRFPTRLVGAQHASANYLMFIDSRITPLNGSVRFLIEQLESGAIEAIWNAHVEPETGLPLISYVWTGIERLAWWRAFRRDGDFCIGLTELDQFPHGTTMFACPRDVFIEAAKAVGASEVGAHQLSDDTRLIRNMLANRNLRYSNQFSCLYRPRTRLTTFIPHTFHRGVVFVDGHIRRGGRYIPFLTLLMVATLIEAYLLLFLGFVGLVPIITVYLTLVGALCFARVPLKASLALLIYLPIFGLCYASGIVSGLGLRLRHREFEMV